MLAKLGRFVYRHVLLNQFSGLSIFVAKNNRTSFRLMGVKEFNKSLRQVYVIHPESLNHSDFFDLDIDLNNYRWSLSSVPVSVMVIGQVGLPVLAITTSSPLHS